MMVSDQSWANKNSNQDRTIGSYQVHCFAQDEDQVLVR